MHGIDLRVCVGVPTVFLFLGCSSTVTAKRPLSENVLAEINETVDERSGTVTVHDALKQVFPSAT